MSLEKGLTDRIRELTVALVGLLLFISILGIPVALFLMQMERLIQLNYKEKR